MRILTDFDGVLTDLEQEAKRVRELFTAEVLEAGKAHFERNAIESLLHTSEQAILKSPLEHGWRSEGRISAYANEDHFVFNNAWGDYLDRHAVPTSKVAAGIQAALQKKGIQGFTGLAQQAFLQMAKESFQESNVPIDQETAAILTQLLNQGHEIVVVSNSSTDRILKMLTGAGLTPVSHPTPGKLRVRGGANKFILDQKPVFLNCDSASFDVARPHFFKILDEERPDVAIGDVFSLDLALPLWLSIHEKNKFPSPILCLRERSYTPEWSKSIFKNQPPAPSQAKLKILKSFGDLLKVIH